VRGLFLINPTPVWGVGPQRLLPYAGGYPIPAWIRGYAARYWDAIRDPATIRSMLDMVRAAPPLAVPAPPMYLAHCSPGPAA
jgi:hypothetical protein